MADTINIIVNGTDNASGVLGRVAGGLDSLASSAASFGTRFGATVSAPIVAVGALGVAFNASREQAEVAFTTMLGSAQAAGDYLDDLAQFAATTPFEFQGLTQAAQRLMAMGFTADDVIPMLTNVGDAVAALGGGQFEIDRVVRALGQMEARGKTSAQEMLQLTEVGIPAWQMLADALGVSVPEAMDMVSSGTIDAATTIEAVLTGMGDQFGGMMQAQSQTWNGVMSTIKDTTMMVLGEIMMPLFLAAKDVLLDFANNVLPQIQAWFAALPEPMRNAGLVLGVILAAAGPLALGLAAVATAIGALLSPIGLVVAAVAGLGVAWATNFMGIRDALQPVVDGMARFWEVIINGIGDGWSLLEWVSVLRLKFGEAGAATGNLMIVFTQIWGVIQTTFNGIKTIITTVLGIIIASVQQNAGAIQALFLNAYTKIKDIVQQALSAVQGIVMGILGAIRSFLAEHGTDIQNTLADAWLRIATIINMALDVINQTVIPILKGIAQFIRDHSAEIQTILGAAWTIIKNVIDGALTLIEGIFKAVLAVLKGDWKGAWEIIKRTVDQVWDNIVAILEEATTIIVTVIGTALQTIYDWFVEKFEAIKGYLQGISLADVGRAIIQGLIDGVRSMAGALADAARGVVNSAIQAAKNLLGISSPSRLFEGIGEDTMEGFILGVLGMGGDVLQAVIDVLGEVEEEAAEQAANIARAMETVLGTLVAAIEAVNALATATLPEVSIGGTVDRIILLLTDIVTRFMAAAGQFEEEGVEAARRLAEAGGAIVGQLQAMIDGFDAVANYRPQVIGPTLNRLFDQLRGTILKLVRIAPEFESLGLDAARRLAEAGGAIVGQLRAMVDGFDAVAAYKPQVIGPTLNRLFDQLRGTILKLVRIAPEFDGPGLAAATTLATAGGAMVGQLQAMVDGFDAVAAYKPQVIGPTLNTLFDQLKGTILKLVRIAPEFDGPGLTAATALATAGGAIAGQLRAMVDGLTAVAAYATAEGLADAVDALAADLETLVQAMAARFGSLDDATLAAYDAAAAFGQRIGAIVGVISPGVNAIKALTGYVRAQNIGRAVEDFALDVLDVAIGLQNALGAPAQGLLAAYDAAAAFGQRIGAIVGVISPGVNAIKALAGYVRAQNIGRAVEAFGLDVVDVAIGLQNALGAPAQGLLDAYDAAAAFGQRIGAIVGVISPGVNAIKALAGYVGAQNIGAAVQAFTADVLVVAEELRQALSGATDETLAAYDAARAFAERISGVFEAIRPGMDLLRELSRYGGPSNIHSGMQTFLRHVEGVMNTLGTTMQTLSPTTVADAVAFSEAARLLVENVRAAMTAASGLANAYDGAFDVAQSWMDGLLDGLRSRLDDLTALMAYIRGLFPSSPAEHGPWRDLPQGQEVAQGWLGGMTAALNRTADLAGALGGVRGMFNGGPGANLQPAYASAGVQVTINVQGAVIREDADIERLAEAVGNELAGQSDVRWRLGAWAA